MTHVRPPIGWDSGLLGLGQPWSGIAAGSAFRRDQLRDGTYVRADSRGGAGLLGRQ